jgi:hypothetical protein
MIGALRFPILYAQIALGKAPDDDLSRDQKTKKKIFGCCDRDARTERDRMAAGILSFPEDARRPADRHGVVEAHVTTKRPRLSLPLRVDRWIDAAAPTTRANLVVQRPPLAVGW